MTSPEQFTAYEAGNPATPPEVLARIAESRPDLRALVAGNPSAPESTIQYLAGIGDAGVDAALRNRPGSSQVDPAPGGDQEYGTPGAGAPEAEPAGEPPAAAAEPAPQGATSDLPPSGSAGAAGPYGALPGAAAWGQPQEGQQWGAPEHGQQTPPWGQQDQQHDQQWGTPQYGEQPQQWGQPGYGQPGEQASWYPAQSSPQGGGYDPYGQATQDPYAQQPYAQQQPYGQPGGAAAPWTADQGSGGGGAAKWIVGGAIAVIVVVAVVIAIIFSQRDDEPAPSPTVGPTTEQPTESTEEPTDDGGGGDIPPEYAASPTFGEDPALDDLWVACEEGDSAACDDLYRQTQDQNPDSGYNDFGNDCAGRVPGNTGWCEDVDPGVSGGGATSEPDDGGQVVDEFALEIPAGGDATQEFTVDSAGTYEVRVTSEDGDPVLVVNDAGGNEVGSNDDGGAGNNRFDPLLETDLEPGTYTVVLEQYGGGAAPLPVEVTITQR